MIKREYRPLREAIKLLKLRNRFIGTAGAAIKASKALHAFSENAAKIKIVR